MKIKLLILGLLIVFAVSAQEQKDSVSRFSLSDAKAFALVNSPVLKNSILDLESAKKKIWETTAIGLPQASASLSASYIITVPTFYEQFFKPNFGQAYHNMPVDKRPADSLAFVNEQFNKAIDDMRFSGTLDFKVSQLIFSGSYIVGLQTSRIYRNLSELSVTKSKDDLNESITNSYVMVLVANENKSILDSTYRNTEQTLNEIKKIAAQGLIDETDVDQMQIVTNGLKSSLDLMTRQAEIAERMLKFQMGMELDSKIVLTDNIKDLLSNSSEKNLLLQDFSVENNVDYKLMDTQSKLMKMNLNLNKSAFLPDIAAYYQHEELLNTKSIAFTPPDLIGVSLSWNIFTSGQRLAKISQAKYSYQKALISQKQVSDGLRVNYEQSKSTYISALDNYNTMTENLKLAEKIYNRSLIKYKQGLLSSTDLTQNQNQYLQSQSNYYNAIIDLTSAKAKLEKILKSAQ